MGFLFGKKKRKEASEKAEERKAVPTPEAEMPDENKELFVRKARGTALPKKAQKIFLCCTFADNKFRDSLISDILSQNACADCVVTYLNADDPDVNDLQNELLDSKVVILAVTDAFLRMIEQGKTPSAFSYATEQGIPVLPVAEDTGLLSRFNKAAGAIHVIAATDVEYIIKLTAQLDNFLVSQELYSKIADCAFSAHLFLSYRKKDLKEARVFMQRFHTADCFKTVAVWYDNYLTAGRVFDDEIKESIEKSDAFVLLVTPNLMEPGNYVLTVEYPYARDETDKRILAVETVQTNRSDFNACYPAVFAYTELQGLEAMFRTELAVDNEPDSLGSERLFLLGAAYLKAILVERNSDYAVHFFSKAAACSDVFALQAAQQLATIFEFGTVKQIDYEAALLWRKRCLELSVELFGEQSTETAEAYNNLGLVYEKLGRIDEAISALEADLSISLKTLGRNHKDTAVTYNNLGELYLKKSDYEKAAEMTEESLDIRLHTLGEDDPAVASSYINLSAVCSLNVQLERALTLAKIGTEILERTRGEKSAETAIAYGNLSSILDELERFEESLQYAIKCVSVFEDSRGIDHIDTAIAYKKLSRIYYSLAEYDKAYRNISKALKIAERILGEDHRDIADYYGEMGDALQMLHRYSEADEMFRKALGIIDRSEHPPKELKAQILIGRAVCKQSFGDYQGALSLYDMALVYSRTALGEEHPITGSVYNDMGVLYRLTNRNEEALAMYKMALAIRIKVSGETSKSVSSTCNNMALVYQLMGRFTEALEFYHRSLRIDTALYGEDHPDIAITYSNLALLYAARDDFSKALDYARTSVRIAENGLTKGWPPMAIPYNTFTIVLVRTGNNVEALKYGLKAFGIWSKELPPNHPNLNSLFNTLGVAYTALGHTSDEFYEWAYNNGLLDLG